MELPVDAVIRRLLRRFLGGGLMPAPPQLKPGERRASLSPGWAEGRPDYARIAVLERELGLTGRPAPELSPFEQGRKRAMERDL